MFGISMWELLLAALLLFVLVGPKRLPEIAKTLAQTLAKLRRSVDDMKEEMDLDEELDFIKEVRSFSPDRLLEDTPPKRPIEPVEPPKGPQDKKPLKSQKHKVSGRKKTPLIKVSGKQMVQGSNKSQGRSEDPLASKETGKQKNKQGKVD